MNQEQSISITDESKLETEASISPDQQANEFLLEYDKINDTYMDDNEDKNNLLSNLLERMKKYEKIELVKDLMLEIETKLKISQVYIDQENQMIKEIKEDTKFNEESIEIDKNLDLKMASYNKYTDKEEEADYPRLSVKFLNKLLTENMKLYYRTYELNDILYLHFKGFKKLENLHLFKNLKVLYLEGNCIKKIEGLESLTQLCSLYLHENIIEKIEGLENLTNLYNLNLSDNCITKIEGLSKLPKLCNLILSRNRIGINGLDDLKGLIEIEPSLMVVNLENNKINEDTILEEIFLKMPQIRVIYLQGNECLRKIPSYRKNFIAKLRDLRYLDDRPVFEDERRFAEAFARGGIEEERKERALHKKEKEDQDIKRVNDFKEMVEGWKENNEEQKKRREQEKEKLLEKCKGKLKKREIKKENEIFTEDDLTSIKGNENNKIKNAHDDLPDLETAKHLKESNYIEYILQKSEAEIIHNKQEELPPLIEIKDKTVETETIKYVEEMINTNIDNNDTTKKKNELCFDELD